MTTWPMVFEGSDAEYLVSSDADGLLTLKTGGARFNFKINTINFKLPTTDGDNLDLITTDGAGDLSWVARASVGTTDHGALTGLLDDDHTQYRLESADHSHASTGLQGGQVSHANLTGVTAAQHHAAVTLGVGSDAALALSGQELTLADVLTPTEHTAIGNSSPHHAPITLGVGSDAILTLAGQELTLGDVATQAELNTHASAIDPHTVYRLESADHSHQTTGVQAGKLDHGLALDGLTDDDHTQYGLKSGTLAQFAATTSAQLAGVLSDETGTDKVVFNTSPTFITSLILTDGLKLLPTADSTTAIQIAQADGTVFVKFDTTNRELELYKGAVMSHRFYSDSAGRGQLLISDALGNNGFQLAVDGNNSGVFSVRDAGTLFFQVDSDAAGTIIRVKASGGFGIGKNTLPSGTTNLGMVYVNQDSTTGAIPALRLDQADVSEEFIRFVGTAADLNLTQSIVEEAAVTTATRAGFIKVYVRDDGNQITDQAYFMPIFTLA